jgi:hypothetical protein
LALTVAIRSSSALSTLTGIAGTFFGFLCGIYMPYRDLGAFTEKIGSFIPFTHLYTWGKQLVLDDSISQLGLDPSLANGIRDALGYQSIGLLGFELPLWGTVTLSIGVSLVCLILGLSILLKRLVRH